MTILVLFFLYFLFPLAERCWNSKAQSVIAVQFINKNGMVSFMFHLKKWANNFSPYSGHCVQWKFLSLCHSETLCQLLSLLLFLFLWQSWWILIYWWDFANSENLLKVIIVAKIPMLLVLPKLREINSWDKSCQLQSLRAVRNLAWAAGQPAFYLVGAIWKCSVCHILLAPYGM